MKFNLDGTQAFIITQSEEGCCISNNIGLIMSSDQMIEVANGLIEYAKKYKNEIEAYNKEQNLQYERDFNFFVAQPKPKKQLPKAHVYLLECGGRYKVGFTNNVERRVLELDKRPYPLNVVVLSRELKNEEAYKEEQNIHQYIKNFRVCGEWYEIPDENVVENIINYIARL